MHILELFTHAGCFSGKDAGKLIQKILQDFPGVSFREVDMLQERGKASEIGIEMSPALVYNGKILSAGIPSEVKLRELLRAETEVKR